ncbi:hypothetical protein [Wolbachia endosymbiont of Pentidionis agamae]|uniref:hypothetical protein n=1 Tax=Wolbachia endosymbiont of Pentidionis agamae TaxID=3110435 RepID=UPI002FD17EA9
MDGVLSHSTLFFTPRSFRVNMKDIKDIEMAKVWSQAMKKQIIRGSTIISCAASALGALITGVLFLTGMIVASIPAIAIAVTIVTTLALAVGGITYCSRVSKLPNTEIDKIEVEKKYPDKEKIAN